MRSLTKVLLFGLCLIVTDGAEALTCDAAHGGEIITAKNGATFCKSLQLMNWLSAHTWCNAIGGKLAEHSSICPVVNGTNCPNMKIYTSGGNVWVYANKTQHKSNFSNISRTNLRDGVTGYTAFNRPVKPMPKDGGGDQISDMYALCE